MSPRAKPARSKSPAAAPDSASADTDGRLQRGARSRALVLDALLAILAEGNYAPSMQEISERAGVSLRLVFHHFQDAESMLAAFVERQQVALHDLVAPIPESQPLATRLRALCEQRARIYERITHVRRAGMTREHGSPLIHRLLNAFRGLKRTQVEVVFAPELRSCHESAQREIAAALGCAASFNTWESLRTHQQLNVDEAQRVLGHLLTGVLRLTPAGADSE